MPGFGRSCKCRPSTGWAGACVGGVRAIGTRFAQSSFVRLFTSGGRSQGDAEETTMTRKYSEKSQETVHKAMHEFKQGKLKSGKSGKKVTNPKQAVAIGLSEARKKGAKVPAKKKSSK
jgi:hypothetical protein